MKIPKDYDVVSNTPDGNKGTNPFDYQGIQSSGKAIADTPGEKAMNDPAVAESNKAQPFGKGGTGYAKGC